MQMRQSALLNDESKPKLGYHASSNQPHHTMVQGAPGARLAQPPGQRLTLQVDNIILELYVESMKCSRQPDNFRLINHKLSQSKTWNRLLFKFSMQLKKNAKQR